MAELEAALLPNPDENRMVGHYWLRNSSLAPTTVKTAIDQTLADIKAFAKFAGEIAGADGNFEHFLVIGIELSTGSQFVSKH